MYGEIWWIMFRLETVSEYQYSKEIKDDNDIIAAEKIE